MVSWNLLGGELPEALRAELVEVTRSRARLVDSFGAERRRIERDLCDGPQKRSITLVMQLGIARMDTPAESPMEQPVRTAATTGRPTYCAVRTTRVSTHRQ